MMPGISIDDMEVGMEVELRIDTLFEDDENEYVVWKWDLATGRAA